MGPRQKTKEANPEDLRCAPGCGYNVGMQEYYIYILASRKNGTLYVGMTEGIAKRTTRHKGRQANEFTAKYDVLKLVYYEKHKSLEEAVKREKQLKKWRRQWKMKLIEKHNSEWQDLFGEVINTGPPAAKPK